jgi:hypothetical protein
VPFLAALKRPPVLVHRAFKGDTTRVASQAYHLHVSKRNGMLRHSPVAQFGRAAPC